MATDKQQTRIDSFKAWSGVDFPFGVGLAGALKELDSHYKSALELDGYSKKQLAELRDCYDAATEVAKRQLGDNDYVPELDALRENKVKITKFFRTQVGGLTKEHLEETLSLSLFAIDEMITGLEEKILREEESALPDKEFEFTNTMSITAKSMESACKRFNDKEATYFARKAEVTEMMSDDEFDAAVEEDSTGFPN